MWIGVGASVDSVWEQKKTEARKLLAVGGAESPASSIRFVWYVSLQHLFESLSTFQSLVFLIQALLLCLVSVSFSNLTVDFIKFIIWIILIWESIAM